MNLIAKRIVISLCSAIVAYFIIHQVQQQNLGDTSTAIATVLIIFVGVLVGAFSGGKGRTRASASGATKSTSGGGSTNEDAETGTVKWFNIKKGYGFITRDSGDDVFVHYRNIVGDGRRSISDGQRVSFIVVDGDKGLQADEVETI
jgi:CspA family cold shock protein